MLTKKQLLKRAAQEMGRKGGKARKALLSPERRSEIARLGAIALYEDYERRGKLLIKRSK